MNSENMVKIVELAKDDAYLSSLRSSYPTSNYYDLSVCRTSNGWKVKLALKPLRKAWEKKYKGRLFENHVEDARVFVAVLGDKRVGWIELGYERWNNRMRIWEFLVDEGFRRKGIGTLLVKQAVKIAKKKRARILVLETQTCDVPAISFYLKLGFELIGFDTAAYSNKDIERKEARLELGLKL